MSIFFYAYLISINAYYLKVDYKALFFQQKKWETDILEFGK